MPQFRPSVYYRAQEFANATPKEISFSKKTYALIKKEMPRFLNESYDGIVRVYRSRRGEWGEWYEHWAYNEKGKPYIFKQGWQ